MASVSSQGYGMLFCSSELGRNYLYAHRVSFAIHNPELPPDLFVCHKCNNPICVNPSHLYLATSAENTRDAAKDGLMPKDSNHWAFISDEAFIERVHSLRKDGLTQKEVAKILKVNQSHISRVLNKKLKHSRVVLN